MLSPDSKHSSSQVRTYSRADSAVFLKTKEKFGGLSNMAGGFQLTVNGNLIRTSEALYQACRFPLYADLQRLIIMQKSPMSAKMVGKPHRNKTREDWNKVRVKIMNWCLRVKLAQHWETFREVLLSTGDLPIVEYSRKDAFWGAKPEDNDMLVGVNALGRLLMQLRERIKNEPPESLLRVEPISIHDFLLYDENISEIDELSDQCVARITPKVPVHSALNEEHAIYSTNWEEGSQLELLALSTISEQAKNT